MSFDSYHRPCYAGNNNPIQSIWFTHRSKLCPEMEVADSAPAVFSAFRAHASFRVCLTLSSVLVEQFWPEGPGMKASLHILASFFVDKYYCQLHGLPWWLSGKEYACNAGDQGSISGSGRSPGEENGNPLQYSCLGNPMDRGAWWATIHGVAEELDTLGDFTTSTTIYVFMYVYIYIYL